MEFACYKCKDDRENFKQCLVKSLTHHKGRKITMLVLLTTGNENMHTG